MSSQDKGIVKYMRCLSRDKVCKIIQADKINILYITCEEYEHTIFFTEKSQKKRIKNNDPMKVILNEFT